jgi:hypothetical protein
MIIYRVAIGRGWTYKTLQQLNSTVDVPASNFSMGNSKLDFEMPSDIPLAKLDSTRGSSSIEFETVH